ncbi:hypothetical protein ABGB16_13610 [Micromonospora sp. B11E3]|uniref:hypothetical protein n=1 Tax=Micromonospora sp. B11E3 TaxID=3153562 RepID=UPI00325CD44C
MGGREHGGRRVRSDRDSRRTWPELRTVEVVALLPLSLGAIWAGLVAGAPVTDGLLDLLCTADRCNPMGLAAAGWVPAGGTIVLAGLIYRHLPPSRPGLYAMTGCVLLLCFGLTVLLGGGAGQAALSGAGALFAGVMAGCSPWSWALRAGRASIRDRAAAGGTRPTPAAPCC